MPISQWGCIPIAWHQIGMRMGTCESEVTEMPEASKLTTLNLPDRPHNFWGSLPKKMDLGCKRRKGQGPGDAPVLPTPALPGGPFPMSLSFFQECTRQSLTSVSMTLGVSKLVYVKTATPPPQVADGKGRWWPHGIRPSLGLSLFTVQTELRMYHQLPGPSHPPPPSGVDPSLVSAC